TRPRNTSPSVPRLTPERKVRTATSAGPGSGRGTDRSSPTPGSRNQNARAALRTGLILLRGREMNPADGSSVLLLESLRQGTGESSGDLPGRRSRSWSVSGPGAGELCAGA